MKIMAWKK